MVQKGEQWVEVWGKGLIKIILANNGIIIIYLTPKMPKRYSHFFQYSFFEQPLALCSQPNLSIQEQHFPLFLFNLKEMLRLGLQEIKVLGAHLPGAFAHFENN